MSTERKRRNTMAVGGAASAVGGGEPEPGVYDRTVSEINTQLKQIEKSGRQRHNSTNNLSAYMNLRHVQQVISCTTQDASAAASIGKNLVEKLQTTENEMDRIKEEYRQKEKKLELRMQQAESEAARKVKSVQSQNLQLQTINLNLMEETKDKSETINQLKLDIETLHLEKRDIMDRTDRMFVDDSLELQCTLLALHELKYRQVLYLEHAISREALITREFNTLLDTSLLHNLISVTTHQEASGRKELELTQQYKTYKYLNKLYYDIICLKTAEIDAVDALLLHTDLEFNESEDRNNICTDFFYIFNELLLQYTSEVCAPTIQSLHSRNMKNDAIIQTLQTQMHRSQLTATESEERNDIYRDYVTMYNEMLLDFNSTISIPIIQQLSRDTHQKDQAIQNIEKELCGYKVRTVEQEARSDLHTQYYEQLTHEVLYNYQQGFLVPYLSAFHDKSATWDQTLRLLRTSQSNMWLQHHETTNRNLLQLECVQCINRILVSQHKQSMVTQSSELWDWRCKYTKLAKSVAKYYNLSKFINRNSLYSMRYYMHTNKEFECIPLMENSLQYDSEFDFQQIEDICNLHTNSSPIASPIDRRLPLPDTPDTDRTTGVSISRSSPLQYVPNKYRMVRSASNSPVNMLVSPRHDDDMLIPMDSGSLTVSHHDGLMVMSECEETSAQYFDHHDDCLQYYDDLLHGGGEEYHSNERSSVDITLFRKTDGIFGQLQHQHQHDEGIYYDFDVDALQANNYMNIDTQLDISNALQSQTGFELLLQLKLILSQHMYIHCLSIISTVHIHYNKNHKHMTLTKYNMSLYSLHMFVCNNIITSERENRQLIQTNEDCERATIFNTRASAQNLHSQRQTFKYLRNMQYPKSIATQQQDVYHILSAEKQGRAVLSLEYHTTLVDLCDRWSKQRH